MSKKLVYYDVYRILKVYCLVNASFYSLFPGNKTIQGFVICGVRLDVSQCQQDILCPCRIADKIIIHTILVARLINRNVVLGCLRHSVP